MDTRGRMYKYICLCAESEKVSINVPIKVSQQQFVTNWQQGTQAAQPKYSQGIQNSQDWAGPTVNAIPQMVAGIQQAFQDGRIAAGINNLGTAGWRTATLAKASNWYQGVTSQLGVQHMTQGAAKLYGMLNTAINIVDGMPRGTLSENLARANAFATSMYNQKRGL